MKKVLVLALCALLLVPAKAVDYCASSSWGYGAGATGGGNATPTLVSTVSQLKSAIGGKKPKDKVVIITQNLTFTSMLTMQDAQNITIMALPGVKLISAQQDATTSGILFIKRSSNIILRNLTFEGPGAYDCDGNDNLCFENVTKAWVDHCDFQDGCDGNFDNKGTTDNITVSWCRFRYLKAPRAGGSGGAADHRFTNLLGSSSSDKPTDGTYNMTWAYCWWDEGCKERMLRCRNASLHFLNCYWNSSVANYYIGPENADCYIEGCTFEGAPKTAKIFYQNYGGKNGAKFINSTAAKGLPSDVTSRTVVTPTYSYTALSAAEAKTMVTNSDCGAGATLVVNSNGEVGSSCDGGSTPDPDPEPVDPPTPTPSGDLTWNFSASEFTSKDSLTIAAGITINGLIIGPNIAYDSNNKTIDGHTFTKRMKTGGKGSATNRYFKFNVTGACTIEVYAISAKSTETRNLNVYANNFGGTLLTQFNVVGTAAAKYSYDYTGNANNIFICSENSGINLYAINVIYSSTPAVTYTLTYDENGGSGEMEEQTVDEGESVTVLANAFTAPVGYSFKEWNTNSRGSGTKYNVGQNVTMNADLTLYAVWQPNTYTITLDADGGTGGSAQVTATYDAEMPNITIPTRTNYTFLGYFSEQNGQGTQYYDANGSSVNSWTTAGNATLYAAWEEQSGDTPAITGDLHFWFFYADDATSNGLTNDNTVFSNMIAASSQKAGSITIDGRSYSITRRTGDPSDGKFGKFTIPTGYKGIFYALAISSGGADRQINLIGEETYELDVPGGSSAYQRLESELLPAGTYSIERAATSGNVRIGVAVLKFIADSPTGVETIENQSAARKVLRNGQVVILREGKTYSILGARID